MRPVNVANLFCKASSYNKINDTKDNQLSGILY